MLKESSNLSSGGNSIVNNKSNLVTGFALILIWVSVQTALFLSGGIKLSVDSTLYLEKANELLSGILPQGREIWYIGYSSFIALVLKLNGGITGVVLLQVLFSGVAAYCVYDLSAFISKKKSVAYIATLLFLLWIKIHQWNFFIYSDSLFTSFCLISFTCLVKSRNTLHVIIALVLVVFTFLIRPTGFALLAGLLAYVIYALFKRGKTKQVYWALLVSLLLICGLLFLLNSMLRDFTLIESYSKAEIIYPDITLGIQPPHHLIQPSKSLSPLPRLVAFAFANPLYFCKLFLIKLILFLGNIKPYFSLFHNSITIVFLYPLYFFAAKSIFKFPLSGETLFMITFIGTQSITVALTSENWDGRFLIPVLPYVFILASLSLQSFLEKSRRLQ